MSEKNAHVFIHETAQIDSSVLIGPGSRIWQNSHIRESAIIGKKVSVGRGVYIGPGVQIGDKDRKSTRLNSSH